MSKPWRFCLLALVLLGPPAGVAEAAARPSRIVMVPPFSVPPELAALGAELAQAAAAALRQGAVEAKVGEPKGADVPFGLRGKVEALGDDRVRVSATCHGASAEATGDVERVDELVREMIEKLRPSLGGTSTAEVTPVTPPKQDLKVAPKQEDSRVVGKQDGKGGTKPDAKGEPKVAKQDGKGEPKLVAKQDGKGEPKLVAKQDGKGEPKLVAKQDGKGEPKQDGKAEPKDEPKHEPKHEKPAEPAGGPPPPSGDEPSRPTLPIEPTSPPVTTPAIPEDPTPRVAVNVVGEPVAATASALRGIGVPVQHNLIGYLKRRLHAVGVPISSVGLVSGIEAVERSTPVRAHFTLMMRFDTMNILPSQNGAFGMLTLTGRVHVVLLRDGKTQIDRSVSLPPIYFTQADPPGSVGTKAAVAAMDTLYNEFSSKLAVR